MPAAAWAGGNCMMSAICFATPEVRMRTGSALSAATSRNLLSGRGMMVPVSAQALRVSLTIGLC